MLYHALVYDDNNNEFAITVSVDGWAESGGSNYGPSDEPYWAEGHIESLTLVEPAPEGLPKDWEGALGHPTH